MKSKGKLSQLFIGIFLGAAFLDDIILWIATTGTKSIERANTQYTIMWVAATLFFLVKIYFDFELNIKKLLKIPSKKEEGKKSEKKPREKKKEEKEKEIGKLASSIWGKGKKKGDDGK